MYFNSILPSDHLCISYALTTTQDTLEQKEYIKYWFQWDLCASS